MKKLILWTISHGVVLVVGFVLGIYYLPILIAPSAPDSETLESIAAAAPFQGELALDLRGSDFLHWGEGTISVSESQISHQGRLAPGPDYRLYLVPEFVEHEDEFIAVRGEAQLIGPVNSFDGFVVDVPTGVDVAAYTTVLIWCETFSEFITSARYR
ncbi:MAG: DM13 domain-containing protein [Alphaproteobacteria bacterium]